MASAYDHQISALEDARWIAVPESEYGRVGRSGIPGNKTAYFRTSFLLNEPSNLELSISANARYRLWINGRPVHSGPCKGDRWRHYYDTIDISPYLLQGENAIAVKVVAYSPFEAQTPGAGGPFSVWSNAAGPMFIASGVCVGIGGKVLADLGTGKPTAGWMVCLDEAIEWEKYEPTHFMGGMERVMGSRIPRRWNLPGLPGGHWAAPEVKEPAFATLYGLVPQFPLQERPIPLLFERRREFRRLLPRGGEQGEPFPIEIPPDTVTIIVLDAGELTTGFIRLSVEGGQGSEIRLLYAESYSKQPRHPGGFPLKGRRDDSENQELIGHEDIYWPSGEMEVYEPFWFRTFRFFKLEIRTADAPLLIHQAHYLETGYPLGEVSSVTSSTEWMRPLWEISLRTLQRCMHETYEDCPYYEQLQYGMDTRLEILFTYAISVDNRLARRAIGDFHASLLPEGILQARYPCMQPQVIPVFSLHWILMLEDDYWQTGDKALIKRYRPTVDAILDWYDRKLNDQGLVENLGYWEFVDWVASWSDLNGAPRATLYGPSTIHNLVYAHALQTASRLNRLTGREEVSREYSQRAEQLHQAIREHCWSEREGFYREGPDCEEYSQHAQVWAVLCDLVQGEEARDLMRRMLNRTDLLPCSYAMSFYLFRALEKTGLYDATEPLWKPWRELTGLNVTTWPEDAVVQRSDCHGWSALPLYEFTRCLLGVKPGRPGWTAIRIEPRPLPSIADCEGEVRTPRGTVNIEWKRRGDEWTMTGSTPSGTPTILVLPDGATHEMRNGGAFAVSATFR